MGIDADNMLKQLPSYLTDEKKLKLREELKSFDTHKSQFYSSKHFEELLQGDVWSQFEILDFKSGNRRFIKGMVLSNSCDVSEDNPRDTPVNVTVTPIVKISKLKSIFTESGISNERVSAKIKSIEAQEITTLFYLPQSFCLTEPHVALLDQLHTLPYQSFSDNTGKRKIFTLNMLGFCLFVFKLSYHFCRLHENIERPVT